MINKIAAEDRHFADHGWLKTHWLFSFAEYFDPNNIHFGNLRVFNDDYVAPHSGFDTHPHSEMEIVTLVYRGALTHQDTMGNEIVINPGEAQRMSAGTGVRHSEYNHGDEPVELYQIWWFPDDKGLTPSYDQKKFSREILHNDLTPLVSNKDLPGVVSIHSDTTLYRGRFDRGNQTEVSPGNERGIFIYVTAGEISVNEISLEKNDQARIIQEESLVIRANQDVDFILIDVPITTEN